PRSRKKSGAGEGDGLNREKNRAARPVRKESAGDIPPVITVIIAEAGRIRHAGYCPRIQKLQPAQDTALHVIEQDDTVIPDHAIRILPAVTVILAQQTVLPRPAHQYRARFSLRQAGC
ncbi:hypothetical protein ACZ87_0066B, partial [Candidatus Erwinia dacicola]